MHLADKYVVGGQVKARCDWHDFISSYTFRCATSKSANRNVEDFWYDIDTPYQGRREDARQGSVSRVDLLITLPETTGRGAIW